MPIKSTIAIRPAMYGPGPPSQARYPQNASTTTSALSARGRPLWARRSGTS
jgi:hypothetical protein